MRLLLVLASVLSGCAVKPRPSDYCGYISPEGECFRLEIFKLVPDSGKDK